MKKGLFIAILIAGCLNVKAQTGQLILAIYPANCIIKINDSVYHQNQLTLKLRAGSYEIQAWAPQHQLIKVNVKVTNDSTTYLVKAIPFAEGFIDYSRQLANYSFKRVECALLPPLVLVAEAAVASALYISLNNSATNYKNLALNEQSAYNLSITQDDLDTHQQLFDKYKKSYNRIYYTRFGLDAACIAGGFFTVKWLIKERSRRKKLIKPTYSEQPLLSVNPVFYLTPFYCAKGITLTLQF